jgi:hypothetical protein
MACVVAFLTLDTIGNLETRSKGLIEYRKHESPLPNGFSDIFHVLPHEHIYKCSLSLGRAVQNISALSHMLSDHADMLSTC